MEAALRAMAEPRRRAILALVADRELSAGEIAEHFDISRPAVSQHVRVLVQADLLRERRDGTRRLYRARADTLEALDRFWGENLARLRQAAERDERSGDDRRRR